MSSNTSRSMLPPLRPAQPRFAPALALKKAAIDPYDPESSVQEKLSFVKKELGDDLLPGTWTTIDSETGVRKWDQNHWRGDSSHESDTLSIKSSSRGGSIRSNNIWDSWAEPPAKNLHDLSHQTRSASAMSLASNNDCIADIDDNIRSHFVDVSNIMKENQRPLTDFERRNQSVLYQGSTDKVKNVVGDRVVSITHLPIDERLQYLDETGKYRDGIDRGPIKKRLMEEWHKRLADRTAEMEHVTKLKREWDALPDLEKTRRIAQRIANTKLLSMFGAGLESTNDLATYEGEDLPEIYKRVSRWTISDHGSVSGDIRRRHALSPTTEGPSSKSQRNGYYVEKERVLPSKVRDVSTEFASGMSSMVELEESDLNLQSPSYHFGYSSRDSSVHASERYGSNLDSAGIPGHIQDLRKDECSRTRSDSWEPQEPRRRPLLGKRKRPDRLPSTASSRISSPSPRPSLATIRPRPQNPSPVTKSSSPTSCVTSNTTVIFNYVPDLGILEDLPERTDFDDKWGAAAKFEKIKDASSKHGRVVMVRLHKPVLFTSSAISERLFGGGIQEIQYHPAERMALVVFFFPAEAASMVKHVKTIRENNDHEYRRLQIDVDWYKGLETKAVYPAQVFTLATMLVEEASRIILITHVSVLKKTQDFAQDMKMSFPDKIIVKVHNPSSSRLCGSILIFDYVQAAISKPIKRYVQDRDGNSGILEFISVKDAFEVMEVFKNKAVTGYEGSTADWLADSCDVAKPALAYCDCLMCNGKVTKLVQGA
ncbi:hypothetical protein MMC11_003562 [Xylographa trunciseda]|nr:hypothetical protein [Xylographa trunciseda]